MATLGLRLYQKTDPNSDFAVLLENKKTKNSLLFQAGTVATLCKCAGEADIHIEGWGRPSADCVTTARHTMTDLRTQHCSGHSRTQINRLTS